MKLFVPTAVKNSLALSRLRTPTQKLKKAWIHPLKRICKSTLAVNGYKVRAYLRGELFSLFIRQA
jgi:hypothetical protein